MLHRGDWYPKREEDEKLFERNQARKTTNKGLIQSNMDTVREERGKRFATWVEKREISEGRRLMVLDRMRKMGGRKIYVVDLKS